MIYRCYDLPMLLRSYRQEEYQGGPEKGKKGEPHKIFGIWDTFRSAPRTLYFAKFHEFLKRMLLRTLGVLDFTIVERSEILSTLKHNLYKWKTFNFRKIVTLYNEGGLRPPSQRGGNPLFVYIA